MRKPNNTLVIRLAWLMALVIAMVVWRSLKWTSVTDANASPATLSQAPVPSEDLLLNLSIGEQQVRLVRTSEDFRLWADIETQRWTSDTVIPFTSIAAAEHIAQVRLEASAEPAWAEVETTIANPGDTPTIFRIPREGVEEIVQRLAHTDKDQLTLPVPMTLIQGGPQTWLWYYSKRGLSSEDRITYDVRFIRRAP